MEVLNSPSSWLQPGIPDEEARAPKAREWRPTVMRIGPLSGIFAMCLAVLSLAADAAILVASDGAPVRSWSAGPSIYLAICTAVSNLAMRYACLHGVVIAWWSRAMRGSTLKKLHEDWKAGSSLYGAIASGRKIGLLGTATIFSTVVIVDGPLLQRASTVQSAPIRDEPVSLFVRMSPEMPRGYSGWWAAGPSLDDVGVNSPAFNATIPDGSGGRVANDIVVNNLNNLELERLWAARGLLSAVTGCADKCRATIRAPALARTACTQHDIPIDFNKAGPIVPGNTKALPLNQQAFMITISLVVEGGVEKINVVTGFSVVRRIGISNNETTLLDPANPRVIAMANNTAIDYAPTKQGTGIYKSTLAGPVALASSRMGSLVTINSLNNTLETSSIGDNVAIQYVVKSADEAEVRDRTCNSYSDPLDDVIGSLNTAMVYNGGFAAELSRDDLANGLDSGLIDSVNTTVIGQVVGEHNIFHSNYWWFFGAVVVELVCVLTLIPTYGGWWRLGRGFSFSPLEIAQAFEAPLLAHCDTNASGRSLANAAPDLGVRYGVVDSSTETHTGGGQRLAFRREDVVSGPQRSTYWNDSIQSSPQPQETYIKEA